MRHFIFLFSVLFSQMSAVQGATVPLVSAGSSWKYLDDGSNQGTAWRGVAYDDSVWAEGNAQLGYGDGDEETTVSYGGSSNNKYITTYFRQSFLVSNPNDFSGLSLWLLRDDGAVVYLNGTEVFRTSNLPAPPTTISYTTLAANQGDNVVDMTSLPASELVVGVNVVAVEVHQQSASSSDLSFDLELTADLQPVSIDLVEPAADAVDVNVPAVLEASVSDLEGDNLTVSFYGGEVQPPPPPGPDFTLIALPDTQYYVSSLNGGNPSDFTTQTDWIVANRSAMNIAFVTHLGDCVENGDQFIQEWHHATNAMYRLEDPVMTLLAEGIPYGIAVGNHDQSPIANPDGTTTYFNQFFGEAHFAGRAYYGGHYGSNNDNHYQLFSASGLDFIIVHLEYDQSPDQTVLTWANDLLQSFSDRRGIVVSHHIIGTGNPASFGTQGQAIYDALKGNANLHFMLSGHVLGEGRRTDVYNGNTVHSFMSDYQGRSGGSGWLRIMEFSPANQEVRVSTYSPTSDQFETDADSEFVVSYDMTPPSTSFEIIQANAGVPSGSTTSVSWNGLAQSTEYEWYAEASDGVNTVTSDSRRFTTAAQSIPVATITMPADGIVFMEPADITIEADASDADGTVTKVEFFEGSNKLGEDTAAPYSLLWSPVSAGNYALTAVAHDDAALMGSSSTVQIFVNAAGNLPPTASITSPNEGANFSAPADISIEVNATDSDGSVFKVEFFEGTNKLGEDTSSPYTWTWSSVPAGSYRLSAVVHDNLGATGSAAPVNVMVDVPPQIADVTRGPYLQMGTSTGMIVRWRTDVATGTRLRYGTNPANLDQLVSDGTLVLNHEVVVTGLQPDTTYFYELGTATHWVPGDAFDYFVTSPLPGTPKPTRIWVIGDSGTGTDAGNAQNARDVRDAYLTYPGAAATDLWLMLGDNAYNNGTDSEYQVAVFDMYPTVLQNTVLWPALGNHDTAGSTSSTATYPYFDIFTLPQGAEAGGMASGSERYYSFDYGNIHFICLDSMTSDRSSTGPMLTWLQNDLQSTVMDWVIAFWHHPPYTKGSHNSDSETQLVEMRQNALPILESGGVDLVLSGHSHSYERSFLLDGHYGNSGSLSGSMVKDAGDGRLDGVGAYAKEAGLTGNDGAVYIVAGSSGKISGGLLNHPAMFISLNELGSVVLDIAPNAQGDHQLDATFLDQAGTVLDYFTIIKQVPLPDPPAAPTSLTASTLSSFEIALDWTDNANSEDGFKVERSLDGINFAEITTVGANVTGINDSGLNPLTTYHYQVRAYNAGGDSAYSNVDSAITDPNAPPAAPTELAATPLDSRVDLSWNASPGADFYHIKRSTTPGIGYADVGTVVFPLDFSDTTAANGTEYFYVVSGENSEGEGPNSQEASAIPQPPPAAPSDFVVVAATHESLQLQWTDNADNETGFILERSTDGSNFNQIAGLEANVVTYLDSGLVPAVTFTYRLKATNPSGDSAAVETPGATTLPPAPTGLVASPGNGQVTLNWNFVAGASSYHMKRSATSGTGFQVIASDVVPTTFQDGTVANGMTYYYVVSAVISGVQGNDSAEVFATPLAPPPAPSGLFIFVDSSTDIDLSWSDNAATEEGYEIDRSTDGLNFSPLVQLPADATSHTDDGLTPDTTYFYRVRAYNAGGESAYIQSSASTWPLPPTVPTGLAAVSGQNVVQLSWDASLDTDTYVVYRALASGGTFNQIAYGIAQNFYDDTSVQNGTQYYYQIVGFNLGGQSDPSPEVEVMTGWPPLPPSDLVATSLWFDSIDLAWTDNSVDELGFAIERSLDGVNYQAIARSPTAPNVASTTDEGLAMGTTYHYRVRALGAFANSAATGLTTATLSPSPQAPTGLVAVPGNGVVDLSWNASQYAETYEVLRGSVSGGPYSTIQDGITATSFSDGSVQNGMTYFYVVKALNSTGSSANSTEVSVTLQGGANAPTDLVAMPSNSSEIDLTWTDNAASEDGFSVERSPDGVNWTVLDTLPANTTGYTDTGLTAGSYYRYRVAAFNSFGLSNYSNEALAAPYIDQFMTTETLVGGTQNGDFALTQQSDDIYEELTERESGGKPSSRYSWLEHKWTTTVVSGASVTLVVEGYRMDSPNDGDQFQFAWSSNDLDYQILTPDLTQYIDTRLTFVLPETLNGQVFIRVTDTDHTVTHNDLETLYVDHLLIRTDVNGLNSPPIPPDGLMARGANSQVDLSWNASAGADSYRVLRSTTSGSGYGEIAAGISATVFTDNSVANGTIYYYVVRAQNAFGESALSVEVSATPMATPPPLEPDGLVSVSGDALVDLTWNASAGAESYRVWRSTTPGENYVALAADLITPSYSDTTVINGTTYYYVVTAVNETGESGYSNETSATPVVSTAPDAPTQLAALVSGKKKVSLTWVQSAGPNVTLNNIYRSTTGNVNSPGDWTIFTISASTSYQDTGLNSGVEYFYYVTALNDSGEESDRTVVVSGVPR